MIKRYYNDHGALVRYEISKEMKSRAARYYKATKRAQLLASIKDTAISFGISLTVVSLLVAWYLINN